MVHDEAQAKALVRMLKGENIAILGPGGHGKTFIMKRAIKELKAKHGEESVAVVALTNDNAYLFPGGKTIHSLLGLLAMNGEHEWTVKEIREKISRNSRTQQILRKLRVIGLDEGPALDPVYIEALVMSLQTYREHFTDTLELGGGCQFIIGDPLQRAPYSQASGRLPYSFQSPVWAGLFRYNLDKNEKRLGEISLNTNHRIEGNAGNIEEGKSLTNIQEQFLLFNSYLGKARLGLKNVEEHEALAICEFFNSCYLCKNKNVLESKNRLRLIVNRCAQVGENDYAQFDLYSAPSHVNEENDICICTKMVLHTRLCPSTVSADKHNGICLTLLDHELVSIKARDQHHMLDRHKASQMLTEAAPETLKLKRGALVYTTRNIVKENIPARTRGFILQIVRKEVEDHTVSVLCALEAKDQYGGGSKSWKKVLITSMKHEILGYDDGRVLCCRNQIPLRLCYALTFAASIGMEFNHVETDFRNGFKAPGLGYTALSRAKNKSGLRCVGLKPIHITSDPNAVEYWNFVSGGEENKEA